MGEHAEQACSPAMLPPLCGHWRWPLATLYNKPSSRLSVSSLNTSPVQLSSECMDLLNRIFVVDESKRITLNGITQHPWYNVSLEDKYSGAYKQFKQEQTEKDRYIQTRRLNQVGPLGAGLEASPCPLHS